MLVIDGVVDMDVGYEANDSGSKQFPVLFINLILYYTAKSVKLDPTCSHVILLKETIWLKPMLTNANRSDGLIQPRSQGSLLLVRDRKTRDQRF